MLKDFLTSVFSRDEVNTGRQPELDWFKTMAILTMILTHVEEVIFSYCWEDYAFCAGSPANAVSRAFLVATIPFGFMAVMGASVPYSRHSSPEEHIDRGWTLIGAWLLLKLMYIAPLSYIFARPTGMTYLEFGLRHVFSSDILCFAGLFFLYYGLLKKRGWGLKKILILSGVIFIAGQFIRISLDRRLSFLEALIGNFVAAGNTSFPFVRWLPAPVIGLVWGYGLRRCRNKDRFYMCVGVSGLVLLGLFLLQMYMVGYLNMDGIRRLGEPGLYYNATPGTTCLSLTLVMLSVSFCYALSRLIECSRVKKLVAFVSRNMTELYFFQWVLIPWFAAFLPRPRYPVGAPVRLAAALGFFALSSGGVVLRQRLFRRHKDPAKS